MTENEQAPGYEPRMAPPTQPVLTPRPPRTSGWPNVVGTIAIVFGALGALGGAWGIVAPAFTAQIAEMVPDQAAMMAVMQKWAGWTFVISCATLATAAILLAGGVGLVKRARWGPSTMRIWAAIKIVVIAGSSVLTYVVQQDTLRAMSQQGFPMAGGALLWFSVAPVLLWGGALPVFMLIWFGRERIRNEVAGWGKDRSATG